MNYKLLSSEFELSPKVLIAYRTFSFTLPSSKKTCVAEGKYIIEEPTMLCASLCFRVRVDKKAILNFHWIDKNLQVDTSGDATVDRTGDFTDSIRKRGKKLDKKDVKRIIDAFEEDYQDIFKTYMITKAKVLSKKK